ncbi:uncharacterized protein LOC123316521 [Coccinella septempunctata]|uniref:uncharacterized protein LOC123316521 n=1 Tax=Coccinella septempunctata TaxID=41139 RepID=UPI001D090D9F|nr:uncharacterized protein LOC123316521 [Coccinella septempunctata]
MWFEILPSMGIVFACMSLPHASLYVLNQLFHGNHFRRSLDTTELAKQYLRDERLTGDAYKLSGLEAIPDA